MRSSSCARWNLLARPKEAGAARLEFAVIVAIFATWVIVSVALLQQSVRDVYTAETADTTLTRTSSPAPEPTSTEPVGVATPTPVAPTTPAPAALAPVPPAPPAATSAAPTRAVRVVSAPAPAAPTSAERSKEAPAAVPPPAVPPPAVPPPAVPPPAAPAPQSASPENAGLPTSAPSTSGPESLAPPTSAPSTFVPPTPPTAGPILALTASVAKKGTLASNVLRDLNPAGTLTAMGVASGGGDLVWMTMEGDYVFNAPHGKDTTVITFTYIQNSIPVTSNSLTISTG